MQGNYRWVSTSWPVTILVLISMAGKWEQGYSVPRIQSQIVRTVFHLELNLNLAMANPCKDKPDN
jgi:hypothetical protein